MSKRASMTAQQIECRSALYGDVCQLRGESIEGLGVESSAGQRVPAGFLEDQMADRAIIAEAVEVLIQDRALPRQVVILEAGCGSASEVVLPFEKRIVGIDIDAEQLKHNDAVEQKIQGDLQTYDLPQNAFDLVTCVDVLEHLQFPEKALANMFRSVKPGGYLLVAGPEPYSYKGLVAQYTPHSMRFVIHKLITGIDAPEIRRTHGNGQVFFPTYLKPACSLKNLVGAAQRCGLEVVYEKAFDVHSSMIRAPYKPFLVAVNLFARWVEALSAGRINLLLADYVLLLKKVARSAKLSMLSGGSIPTMSVSER
jgi:SAM-dependent methyltransferase